MADDEVKISETLEFLTQIHTSWDNSEQRVGLRARPRRTISYDYMGTETWQSQYLRSLVYSQQTQMFQIPLWHGADRVYDQLYASQANIQLDPKNIWQWRGCSGAVIWTDDNYGGDYFPIAQLTSTGIVGLGKQLAADMSKGSGVICPVAWGCLSQSDKYTNVTGNMTSLNMTVEIMREIQAPPFPITLDQMHYEVEEPFWGKNLPTTYNGYELFMKPPSWANDINATFTRNANRLDNRTGFFLYDLKSVNPTESKEVEYIMHDRVEINNMQRFFMNCSGKLHSFYAPTWLHDIEPVGNCSVGDTSIITKFPYYWKYFSRTNRRKKAIVFYKDRKAEIINIAGYTTDETGDYGKILLESPLTRPINVNTVDMISFLCRYRFDNDAMTTGYEAVDTATTTLMITEVTE